MKFKKLNIKLILKYLSLLFVCLIFSCAEINGLSPFLFALFFACIYVGLDEKILSGYVVASAVLTNISLESFLISLTVVFVGLVCFYVHRFMKKRIHLLTLFGSYLVSLITYVYYNYNDFQNLLFYVLLGLICLFVFIVVLQVLFLRKNCFLLTLDESVCFLFAVSLVGLGVASVKIFNCELYRIILTLIIFVCVAIGNPTLTYALALSFSFGVSLSGFSLLPVAEFIVLALLVGVFRMPNKFKMVFMAVLGDVFLQYIFFYKDWQLIFDVIPILIAGIIFVALPNKYLRDLENLVYVKKSEISSRNLINTTRKNIRKRMTELSNVFLDMKNIHLNMVKKELKKEELVAMLIREVNANCCKDCLDKNRCNRSLGTDNRSSLENLINIAITKGKISLLDIPASLSNRCGKVNYLISLINRLTDEYRQFKNMMADVNNVKILLADQMGAVSKLLIDLGDEIDTNVRFDIAKENKIISKLLSLNIQCKEVLLYNEKDKDFSVVLIVKSEEAGNPLIEKAISEIMKFNMTISKILPLEEGDFCSVTLKKMGKYDCMFGLASCNKVGNEECGDCHSIIRLGGNRFLLALCDGMGTGVKAHRMSAMTLGLIENFYKAGFDNDIILESVNKLLAVNNQESYSTLDVCLLDLENEIADFVKVGAPFGMIKRESGVEIVEGGALPIGALDTISPITNKSTVGTKDVIILATDGIVDAFETQENLVDYVSQLACNNPQTIAESILNEAVVLNNMSAKDDMTVLVARTYLKN